MQSAIDESNRKTPVDNFYSKTPLHPKEFFQISQIVYEHAGIRLNTGKEELVRSRLIKRLRALGIASFHEYLKHVKEDRTAQELNIMIDSLTTNKTSFFRENQHFEYLRTQILPALKNRNDGLRVWSAGCSTGEEPYSIAMLLCEEWPSVDRSAMKILATDISSRVLAKARVGEYEADYIRDVPAPLLAKYFSVVRTNSSHIYRVNDSIRKMVRFARLNLMEKWPMKGPFDVLFCRNVMIYFDSASQKDLVHRFSEIIMPGGHLLVGHAESLVASSGEFKYVQPATYVK
jgi:chemotaxis protein methyltransferase CheR